MIKNLVKKIIVFLLEWEARLVLARFRPKIVAVTGTVGKTSTKDAVFAVLSHSFFVRKSQKSYNSEIGLPLTILGCDNAWNNPILWLRNLFDGLFFLVFGAPFPVWLVLEVGVGHPGDMRQLIRWLKVDVAIFTRFGDLPVHVEFFKSINDLIEEKSFLLKALKKDGLLVLNADDAKVLELRKNVNQRAITFGFSAEADVIVSQSNVLYRKDEVIPEGINFRIDCNGKRLQVNMEDIFGQNHVYAGLAALAFAYGQKINLLSAVEALRRYDTPPGRMRLIEGLKGSWIIDDTYNSSPTALDASLETLREIKCSGRKLAVLGDMLELGKHTVEAHRAAGRKAAGIVDTLVVVGKRAHGFIDGALAINFDFGKIKEFEDARLAGKFIEGMLEKGDLVLIKGSQSMRMERAVEEIMARPEDKEKLLVRQEQEWLKR